MWIVNPRTGTAVNIHRAKVIRFQEVDRITGDGPRSAWVILVDDVEIYSHAKREDVVEKLQHLHRRVSARTLVEMIDGLGADHYGRNGEEI